LSSQIKNFNLTFTFRVAPSNGPASSTAWNDTLNELAVDFANVSSEWNAKIVPIFAALPYGSKDAEIDTVSNGLDGKNIWVDQLVTSASSDKTYFDITKDRPATIYEALNKLYQHADSQISNVNISVTEMSSALTAAEEAAIGANVFDSNAASSSESLDGKTEANRLEIISLNSEINEFSNSAGKPIYVSLSTDSGDATQNVIDLKAAIDSLGDYDRLVIGQPGRTYPLASAQLATYSSLGITVSQSFITIEGNCSLNLTGSTTCMLFYVTGEGFTMRNLVLNGGNISRGGLSSGAGVACRTDYTGTGTFQGPTFENIDLIDWTGQAWLWLTAAATANVQYPVFRHITSSGGSDPDHDNISVSAATIRVQGTIGDIGEVYGSLFEDCDLDAYYIKNGIALSYNVIDSQLRRIRIRNAGYHTLSPAPDGAYAILNYDNCHGTRIENFDVSGYTCGIYAVGASKIHVSNGRVRDQEESDAGTLLRAAIAIAGSGANDPIGKHYIGDVVVDACHHGISVQNHWGATVERCVINMDHDVSGAAGIKISGSTSQLVSGPFYVSECEVNYPDSGMNQGLGLWILNTDGVAEVSGVYTSQNKILGFRTGHDIYEYPDAPVDHEDDDYTAVP
jgi:hypothetical protein